MEQIVIGCDGRDLTEGGRTDQGMPGGPQPIAGFEGLQTGDGLLPSQREQPEGFLGILQRIGSRFSPGIRVGGVDEGVALVENSFDAGLIDFDLHIPQMADDLHR